MFIFSCLGYGRRAQRIIRAITELAGIENIRCKIVGRTTPLTVVRTTFQGLQMQVSVISDFFDQK